MSPEEIRAAFEVHRELPPEYADAVVDSFIERMSREISAQVDARVAAIEPAASREVISTRRAGSRRAPLKIAEACIAVVALATLVGMSHVLYSTTHHEALVLLWVLVAAACAVRAAQRLPGRASRQARRPSR
jgi:type VI protein secretion system component VasF